LDGTYLLFSLLRKPRPSFSPLPGLFFRRPAARVDPCFSGHTAYFGVLFLPFWVLPSGRRSFFGPQNHCPFFPVPPPPPWIVSMGKASVFGVAIVLSFLGFLLGRRQEPPPPLFLSCAYKGTRAKPCFFEKKGRRAIPLPLL